MCLLNCPTDGKNDGTETPLHMACYNGQINVVKLLVLEYKADLNMHNFQDDSPIQLAAQFGHIDVVNILINDFNCNPTKKDLKVKLSFTELINMDMLN